MLLDIGLYLASYKYGCIKLLYDRKNNIIENDRVLIEIVGQK